MGSGRVRGTARAAAIALRMALRMRSSVMVLVAICSSGRCLRTSGETGHRHDTWRYRRAPPIRTFTVGAGIPPAQPCPRLQDPGRGL